MLASKMLTKLSYAQLYWRLFPFPNSKIARRSADFDFSGFFQCNLEKSKSVNLDLVTAWKFDCQDAYGVILIVKLTGW
jgi:hypothetical protein